jgi:hypothetical protein
MAVWTIPAKILLPAWMFEGQIGRLPNGHQVLGYVSMPQPWSAAAHVFDSDGHHLATHARSGHRSVSTAADREKTAREALRVLLEPLKIGGWQDADIWDVRFPSSSTARNTDSSARSRAMTPLGTMSLTHKQSAFSHSGSIFTGPGTMVHTIRES